MRDPQIVLAATFDHLFIYLFIFIFNISFGEFGYWKKKKKHCTGWQVWDPWIVWKNWVMKIKVMLPNECEKMSDEWWVMKIEWRKLSDEKSLPKQALKLIERVGMKKRVFGMEKRLIKLNIFRKNHEYPSHTSKLGYCSLHSTVSSRFFCKQIKTTPNIGMLSSSMISEYD